MTTYHLHPLLDPLRDTREIVIGRSVDGDGLLAVWRVASQDARAAYARWRAVPGLRAHAAYLAAEDQADAAVASLRGDGSPLEPAVG